MTAFFLPDTVLADSAAGSEGFDARIALSGSYISSEYKSNFKIIDGQQDKFGGLATELEFGYRWQHFGIYYEQDLGGAWIKDNKNKDLKNDDSWFVGGSYFVARGFFAFKNNFETELSFGIGAIYGNGSSRKDFGKSDYLFPFIVDDDINPGAAFALRLQLGFNYYFSSLIAVGAHFNYSVGFKHHSYSDKGGEKSAYEYTKVVHKIDPGLHVIFRF